MKEFNVIIYDFNRKRFTSYDVLPHFRECYKRRVAQAVECPEEVVVPKTLEEFKKFVKDESLYQFWSRCEYEIILSDWPPSKPPVEEKWDVHRQLMMNLDLIAEILFEEHKPKTSREQMLENSEDNKRCQCGGELVFEGSVMCSNPPQYPYTCKKCGKRYVYRTNGTRWEW